MGAIVDVTSPTFDEAVLEQSYQMPVVIDFYAQWCGPCQMLKPLLEKLTQEYEFTLAKVDIDQNPELAGFIRLRGCRMSRWRSRVRSSVGLSACSMKPNCALF
jgi:putative thioredoxin